MVHSLRVLVGAALEYDGSSAQRLSCCSLHDRRAVLVEFVVDDKNYILHQQLLTLVFASKHKTLERPRAEVCAAAFLG